MRVFSEKGWYSRDVFRTIHLMHPTLVNTQAALTAGCDPALVHRLARGTTETDTIADAVVAAVGRMKYGWELADHAMTHGLSGSMPPELHDMLAPLLDPPDWVQWDLVDAGARVMWRGHIGFTTSLLAALSFGYRSGRLSQSLVRTGRIDRLAAQRLQETARWVVEATAPGGMRPGAVGLRLSVRVRLAHAMVRRHLRSLPDWDHAAWGEPINVTDSAMTVSGGFLVVPIRVMERSGFRFSAADKEAMAHLWRWIGFVMGVDEDLLPTSYLRAEALIDTALAAIDDPDEGSRALMRALVRNGIPEGFGAPGWMLPAVRMITTPALSALFWFWNGPGTARRLGLRWSPANLATPLIPPLARTAEALRIAFGDDERIGDYSRARVRRMLDRAGAPPLPVHPKDAVHPKDVLA